ncbi:TPA: tyrosine-type recombinase/integrase [Stenotrophomonas maltophilia]|nr:tyrosine-type recombinase/integrase [Stenotrophomonas maltophilia]EKT4104665.1 tyrosine-type recombinase/integrase [Stenotrophomonas maltophilia]MBA0301420.1 hypothetical protein [Stenotrophomonas maltophilia]MBH1877209.1 tyrosine-type recombinase/integrase [Stenotrophomonas maltophilia]MBN5074561.1 tyrosine-type recombinase/integrase [Stenotrophomonas maltophilia]MDT3449564.1 tyrosine-type recombinase/integrase [Stenotrophomonas maltophilia]
MAVDQALVAAGLKAKPGSWTLATVRHRVAVLSTAHRLKQAPNPCEQPAIRTVLSRAARAAVKRGDRDHRGAIFRRLWKQRVGPALSPAAVGEIVQRRARLAGLEGDFGGHSLRSGFVTEASRQGVALAAIMQLTEHRSVSSVVGYFQGGSATTNPAARLLED